MRDAEVEELHAAVRQQEDVPRLDVAMDDLFVVRRGERVEDLIGDVEHEIDREPFVVRLRGAIAERFAVEQLHHEERAAVFRDVVVDDADHAVVIDAVRDAPLAKKPLAHLGLQIFVHELHCTALAVAMGRGVDRRHPADAQHRIETPLRAQRHPDAGGDVRWNTKIPGLVSGFSYMKKDSTLEGKLNAAGGLPYVIESSPQYLMSWYGDLTRGKVHLSAEYRRDHEILDVLTFGTHTLSDFSSHGWFAAGSYKITKKLEVGSYYSAFYVNHPQAAGDAANHLFDKTVSARYDVTRYFHVKVEGHFIDGYGDLYSAHGFYLRSNPTGTKPTTNLLIVRTGFSF